MSEEKASEIAYQNKDIASKIFAEKFIGKSLEVYGLRLPKIKEVLPTNLPAIQANELRLDNLFLLENDSLALIDYESTYDAEDKLKYLDYVTRIAKRYYKTYKSKLKIEIIIIYTADVIKQQTKDSLDLGSVTLKVHQAFLSGMDSDNIMKNLIHKIKKGQALSDEELMQFIILPLTYKGIEEKNESIKKLFELSKEIKEEKIQLFLLSGILVFTDKVITDETAKRIKEWISMTKVARLFEEEKIEAVNAAIERERQQARQQAKQQALDSAKELFKEGLSPEKIVKCLKLLSLEDVKELQKNMD